MRWVKLNYSDPNPLLNPVRAEHVEAPSFLFSGLNREGQPPSTACLRQSLRTGFDKLRAGGNGFAALHIFTAILMLNAVVLSSAPALAQSGLPPAPYAYVQLDDPAKEARAKALMEELRCLVCQGQSIADSDAALAGDMRSEVRTRILAGERPEAIRDWLIARYGNWVTYDPPLGLDTALLYIAPIAALLFGIWLAFGKFRRKADEGAA